MFEKNIVIKELDYTGSDAELEFTARTSDNLDYVFFRAREEGILRMNMFINRSGARELRDFLNEYLER